jgi:hypothetical protein
MEGEELILLAELHLCYTKNAYHCPVTLQQPRDNRVNNENRNNDQDMMNYQVQAEKEKGRRQRSCEEIPEEQTSEIGNHLETGNSRIWHRVPLQAYSEPSPP